VVQPESAIGGYYLQIRANATMICSASGLNMGPRPSAVTKGNSLKSRGKSRPDAARTAHHAGDVLLALVSVRCFKSFPDDSQLHNSKQSVSVINLITP
jgi:hypothetical protein